MTEISWPQIRRDLVDAIEWSRKRRDRHIEDLASVNESLDAAVQRLMAWDIEHPPAPPDDKAREGTAAERTEK